VLTRFAVSPHPRIANRSQVKVVLSDFVSNQLFLGPDLLGRALLWAMRGELSWPFGGVQGFWGLIRKLEGHSSQRYDLLDEGQLHQWMSTEEEALVWTPRLDSSGDWPTALSKEPLDLGAILQAAEETAAEDDAPRQLFMQFLLTSDDDDDQIGGWSVPR
jgi:hypothetical protein